MVDDALRTQMKASLDDLFVVLAGVVFGASVLEVFLRDTPAEPLINVTYLALYALAMLFALLSGALRRVFAHAPLMIPLVGLPLLSVLWSTAPSETLERAIGLLGTSALAVFIALHYDRREALRLIAIASAFLSFMSLIAIFAIPSIGVGQSGPWAGVWTGLHQHKNALGAAASVACIVLFYATFSSDGRDRAFFFVAFLASALLCLGSFSATSILVTIFGLTLAIYLRFFQRAPNLALLVGVIALFFLPVAYYFLITLGFLDTFLELMGKDPELTGRDDIWTLVWSFIEQRFWLGYGYGAFWQLDTPWLDQIEARLYFTPHYSHNALLEMWLDGGVVLVTVFIALLVGAFVRAAALIMKSRDDFTATFPLVYLATFVARNVTESLVLVKNDLLWVLFLIVAVSLGRDVRFRLTTTASVARA